MPPVVLPIYLDQPSSGCILPLIDFVDAGEIQGLGTAPDLDQLPSRRMEELNSHLDARLSVGLFGMAGLDASGDWNTQSFEWVRFGSQSSQGAGVGYTVQWGFGYRMHLQSNQGEFGANVGQQALAFKTRLKGLQTSFAAETFGVRDYGLYRALPAPDGYDANTGAAFKRIASANLDAAITADVVTPVPLGVTFGGDIANLAVKKALGVLLAASMIKAKKPKADAIAAAIQRELRPQDVEQVYAAWPADPGSAAHLAERWLHIDGSLIHPAAKQREIEGLLESRGVASAPIGGAGAALSVERLIVRSQLVDIETATKAGYGGAQAGLDGDVRRLVFEIFSRSGPVEQTVVNGVARLNANVSGLLRVNCLNAHVQAALQASFSGVTADAAINHRTARFSFVGHGYSSALDHLQLTSDANATEAPDRLAQVKSALELLADPKNHKAAQLPDGIWLQCGAEEDPSGFPGARAIVRALEGLRDGESLGRTRSRLRDLHLEASAADAVSAVYKQGDASAWLEGLL